MRHIFIVTMEDTEWVEEETVRQLLYFKLFDIDKDCTVIGISEIKEAITCLIENETPFHTENDDVGKALAKLKSVGLL